MPVPYSGYQQTPPTMSVSPSQPPPYPLGHHAQFPGQPPVSSPSPRPLPPSTQSVAMAAAAVAASNSVSAEEERRQIEESERIKRQSLETAVEDKIRRHVTAVLNEAEKEMVGLQKTQKGLQDGSRRINEMMEEMEKREREVDQSIAVMKDKNAQLESLLEYLRAQPDDVNIDDAVSATTPLYEQILQLYAEENAIEDTVYYLGEALRKGVIELETFLKYVRELSRKQFMARATIMKARSTAGLAAHGQPA
jgi:ESCRT-I complex subunit TSG101